MIYLALLLCLFSTIEAMAPIVAAYYDKEERNGFLLNKMPVSLLTDLYFAYASVEAPSKLESHFQLVASEDDKVHFEKIAELKKNAKNLNLFLSIGGDIFNDPKDVIGIHTYQLFSQMVSSRISRARFIESLINYAYRFDFDGVDIDWRYPGDASRGGKPADMENFLQLLKEMNVRFETIQPKLLISATFPPLVPAGLPKNFQDAPETYFSWISECSKYLHRVQITAYNYHTPFDTPKITGVSAPLMRDTNPNSPLFIEKTIDLYLKNGVPKEKMILGIPLFGNAYQGVSDLTKESYLPGKTFLGASLGSISSYTRTVPYYDILKLLKSSSYAFAKEPLTETAIAYSVEKKEWISFDNPDTIKLKAELAAKKGLGGIFFWTLDQDDSLITPPFPCITAGKAALMSQ